MQDENNFRFNNYCDSVVLLIPKQVGTFGKRMMERTGGSRWEQLTCRDKHIISFKLPNSKAYPTYVLSVRTNLHAGIASTVTHDVAW